MVVLAAAIANKRGQVLLSRQFEEISKSRLESLVNIFPRLISRNGFEKGNGSVQHTSVETDDVRYLYHPLESNFYLLILTTKVSNIVEDQATLSLFAKVVPEYCRSSLTEANICDAAFDILFAFDEVISLSHKEDLTITQIKTITDMDSHDERIYLAMRQSQERDAKEKMKLKAKELEMQRRLQMATGSIKPFPSASMLDTVVSSPVVQPSPVSFISEQTHRRLSPSPVRQPSRGKTLKLTRSKGNQIERRIKHLSDSKDNTTDVPEVKQTPILFRLEEKIAVQLSHERGLKSMEVTGILNVTINDKSAARIRARLEHDEECPIQIQIHPNLDKNLFTDENILAFKQDDRLFPLKTDVYLLKWKLISTNINDLPLQVTIWPNKTSRGIELTIEYQLRNVNLVIHDFWLSVPLGISAQYEVSQLDEGEYSLERRLPNDDTAGRYVIWKIPLIDKSCSQGIIELSIDNLSNVRECFPIDVGFSSTQTICGIRVVEVINPEEVSSTPEFALDISTKCGKYRIDV